MKNLCFEESNGSYPVRLIQTGFDAFTVSYGLQVKRGLNYADAAAELGTCLMHLCACEGRLDNRTKAEARKAGDRKPYHESAI